MDIAAYAAPRPRAALEPVRIPRRDLRPHDILIDIAYAGICHSDIHQAREEWGTAVFPMVPGHEIAGVVSAIGDSVTRFAVGDRAGVGCFVDSCRECTYCLLGEEQLCRTGNTPTYNGYERDGTTPTYGGYSTHIVVDQSYAVTIPESMPLDGAAPLLCAGITLYSPLRKWKVDKGTRVGVLGLGGLGHMGVKLAAAMGAEVTVISHSPGKAADAERLGAHHFLLASDRGVMNEARHSLDLIAHTVSADIDLNPHLALLAADGVMVTVGMPTQPFSIRPGSLIMGRRAIAGSGIGGIRQTQEMIDFCADTGVVADIELIDAADVNKAWDRVVASDVRYRFVIDATTLES